MRVHFDSQIFAAQPYGGISRYFAGLVPEMATIVGVQPKIFAPLHVNGYLRALPGSLVQGGREPCTRLPKALLRISSLIACAAMQRADPSDILHRTYYYPLCHLPSRAKNVLTVYDMIHEKFPQHFSAHDPIARWKKQAIHRADKIICISEHTRKDVLELNRHLPPERVSVTHLGFDPLSSLLTDETGSAFRIRTLGTDVPYLLFVGSRGGHKNFTGLLRAYAASSWLRKNFALLCFGGGAFTKSETIMIENTAGKLQVHHSGGSDATLAACYRHASLFVYPSLYEGFGIPPLEAMSLDCPVACSHTSSIPEVVGDAAALFDPTRIEEMAEVMETVLQGPSTVARLLERGKTRVEKFSWRRCAEETVAIYRETLTR